MSDYVYQAYPAWRYHPELPARMVQNAAEDEALGKGWVDLPTKLPGAAAPAPPPDAATEPPDDATPGLEVPDDDESESKPTRARKK